MRQQALVFFSEGLLTPVESIAEDYPLRQTQALAITLEEISAWVEQARRVFGETKPRALDAHFEWFDMVDNVVEDTYSAIEEEEDQDVIKCRLKADDPLVEEIEVVLDNCPSDDEVIEGVRNKAVGTALAGLANFWVEQLRLRIVRLQAVVMGDGEVLAIINRQQLLANLHF